MAELSAAQVSEGWNGFSLLPALSFPGEHLEKIIPLIVQYCNVDDDELREYCFQAFESFVRRCVPLGNASAPSCASLSSWCKYPYIQHPGRSAFLQVFLLRMEFMYEISSAHAELEWNHELLYLSMGGCPSVLVLQEREFSLSLECFLARGTCLAPGGSWKQARGLGRRAAELQLSVGETFTAWKRSPAELLRCSPRKGGSSQGVYV